MPSTSDYLWFVTTLGFTAYLYPDHAARIINAIPEMVIYGLVGVLLVLAALDISLSLTSSPLLMFGSVGMYVAVIAADIYALALWPRFGGLGVIPAAVAALALWFVSLFVVFGIVESIHGVDSDNREQERRERADDPYGDKHAAQILDSENGS